MLESLPHVVSNNGFSIAPHRNYGWSSRVGLLPGEWNRYNMRCTNTIIPMQADLM